MSDIAKKAAHLAGFRFAGESLTYALSRTYEK